MFETLDPFDRAIAHAVGEAFPEWIPFATIQEADGERAFVLEIKAPSRKVGYPLRIDTYGGEITVSFEHYHAHFDEFRDGTGNDAFTLVTNIISGDHAVVSYWRDDLWCGSIVLEQGRIPVDNEEYPYANRIKVRSWSGALDEDIACVPRG